MGIQHIVREVLLEEILLLEGPHDPVRLKAIFMAGAPGSGKGTALRTIFGTDGTDIGFTPEGLRIVNADTFLEKLAPKQNPPVELAPDPKLLADYRALRDNEARTAEEEKEFKDLEAKLKKSRSRMSTLQQRGLKKVTGGSAGMSAQRLDLDPEEFGQKYKEDPGNLTTLERHITGRLGVVIDGTAANYDKIKREKAMLDALGYDTMMLFVSVPLEQAQQQNIDRGKQPGGRRVYGGSQEGQWHKLQENLPLYEKMFGDNFVIVDADNPAKAAIPTINKFLR